MAKIPEQLQAAYDMHRKAEKMRSEANTHKQKMVVLEAESAKTDKEAADLLKEVFTNWDIRADDLPF